MEKSKTACYCRHCNRVTEHNLIQDMTPLGPTELAYECDTCKLRTLEHEMGYEMRGCSNCGRVEKAAIYQAHICSYCNYRNPAKTLVPMDITSDPELALLTGIASLDEIPTRGEVS